MFLNIDYNEPIILSDAATLAVFGIIGVFAALIALVMVVKAVRARRFQKGEAPADETQSVPAESRPTVQAVPGIASGGTPAIGSQGEIDLYNIDDRTAAMLMAIVADDLKAELNTLRFISIREAD